MNMNINGKNAADILKDGAKVAAAKAIEGAQKVTDIAALKLKITSVEAKRDAEFTRLGRLTYRKLKSDEPDTDTAAKIAATVEKIEKLNAELLALKKEEQIKK